MQLPDGSFITLVPTKLQSHIKGINTYTGQVAGIESGWFAISIEKDKAFGQVNVEYMVYEIRYDKSLKSHVLTEIDQSLRVRHTPDPLQKASSPDKLEPSGPVLFSHINNAAVRVLILYASDVSYPSTLAANVISALNDSLFDDGVDPDYHFVLAGLRNLGNDLSGVCKENILWKMRDADSPFASLASWINSDDADVVLTIATVDENISGCQFTGSLGRIGGAALALLDSSLPYAVTMDNYAIGDFTALHEIGHVMGGGHSDDDDDYMEEYAPLAAVYGRGIISSTGEWQTIMGSYYENDCQFPFPDDLPNPECVRINRWSDPDKTYAGEDRGVEFVTLGQGPPLSADMISALATQMQTVAAWESYPYSAPGAPTNFDWEPGQCYGLRTATWDEPSNTDINQLFLSFYSNFSNPSIIYHGISDLTGVNVSPGGTRYVRVRSCNGSGCGSFSTTQLQITWQSSCDNP
jgi:hypothetical protein